MNFKEILFFNALFACFYSGIALMVFVQSAGQIGLFDVLAFGLFGSPLLSAILLVFPSLKKEKVEKETLKFFQKKKIDEGGEKNERKQCTCFD